MELAQAVVELADGQLGAGARQAGEKLGSGGAAWAGLAAEQRQDGGFGGGLAERVEEQVREFVGQATLPGVGGAGVVRVPEYAEPAPACKPSKFAFPPPPAPGYHRTPRR